jgi:hypothetical protein
MFAPSGDFIGKVHLPALGASAAACDALRIATWFENAAA